MGATQQRITSHTRARTQDGRSLISLLWRVLLVELNWWTESGVSSIGANLPVGHNWWNQETSKRIWTIRMTFPDIPDCPFSLFPCDCFSPPCSSSLQVVDIESSLYHTIITISMLILLYRYSMLTLWTDFESSIGSSRMDSGRLLHHPNAVSGTL